ncbi:MAG TPA: hypothetical protein VE082_03675, partial [Desulfobaccales bacterium]|nr:hypothetical protein [Desulfobaccales bacterium]
ATGTNRHIYTSLQFNMLVFMAKIVTTMKLTTLQHDTRAFEKNQVLRFFGGKRFRREESSFSVSPAGV